MVTLPMEKKDKFAVYLSFLPHLKLNHSDIKDSNNINIWMCNLAL